MSEKEKIDYYLLAQRFRGERAKFFAALLQVQAACSFFRGDEKNGLEEIGEIVTEALDQSR